MPLVQVQDINSCCFWGIWEINENEAMLASQVNFDLEDLSEFNQIHNPSKRLEWLAGKLIIKSLVDRTGKSYQGIYKDEHGKPFLTQLPFEISISHSQKFVACILSTSSSVGIDLERIKPKVLNVKKKFLSVEELNRAQDDLEVLTMYWCSKEALYKLNGKKGVIFSRDLFVKLGESIGFITTEGKTVQKNLIIEKLEDYIISLAL